MKQVGFGVIGTGFWGKNHARVLSELDTTRLIAVCDVNADRAKAIGKQYDASWYSHYEDLLGISEVEAVCICTPTTSHANIASTALRYNKHLLIEKPIADTVPQAETIVAQAEEADVQVMVGFIERFNPALRRLQKIIDHGDLGEIVLAFARRVGKWPDRVGDVGVVKDSAIHDIDIMRFLFHEDPQSVYARAGSIGHKFEDYAQIVLSFSGVKTGFVESNWLTPHKIRTLTVTGKDAIASMDFISQELVVEDVEMVVKPKHVWEEPLKLELDHFATCIIENQEPDVSAHDGLVALQICDAALTSAKTGAVIPLHIQSVSS
ncbi:MAG: Gfo/Idh/MocA family oxidoreductase [Candidatus Bathyarchaeota archaeon]|nr:MAG: Gfo/Idh/MocA family oxidoreductase [Candidatus Bathyarchaeota archaeon]